jgi:hypothetical protein
VWHSDPPEAISGWGSEVLYGVKELQHQPPSKGSSTMEILIAIAGFTLFSLTAIVVSEKFKKDFLNDGVSCKSCYDTGLQNVYTASCRQCGLTVATHRTSR